MSAFCDIIWRTLWSTASCKELYHVKHAVISRDTSIVSIRTIHARTVMIYSLILVDNKNITGIKGHVGWKIRPEEAMRPFFRGWGLA